MILNGKEDLILRLDTHFTFLLENVLTKEYVSLLERTASTFVFQRKDSPNLSLPALTAVIQTDR